MRAGLVLAVVSAVSFGLSGSLARGLLDAGWSPGAVVLARLAIGALVVAPLAARALRGRWGAAAAERWLVLLFGAVPVAGAQFAYFSAVAAMDVGPALLIEYTAPAAVVVWLWLRHGERPRPLTVAGAGIAALGLVLVLDLLSGADLAPGGVLWALLAMVGAASYFVLSADPRTGLPPVALAGRRPRGRRARPGRARRRRHPADARDDRLAGVRRGSRALVAAAGRPRRRHRRARLLHRDRRQPAARLAPGLVRRAARGRRGGWLRVAAARPAPGHAPARRRRDRLPAWSSSSSASARRVRTPPTCGPCAQLESRPSSGSSLSAGGPGSAPRTGRETTALRVRPRSASVGPGSGCDDCRVGRITCAIAPCGLRSGATA